MLVVLIFPNNKRVLYERVSLIVTLGRIFLQHRRRE
jgi:hypothetical protein